MATAYTAYGNGGHPYYVDQRTGRRFGGEHRGSSYDRRARRRWLLSPKSGFGGNDETVPCVHCGEALDDETLTVDRIVPGGSYKRANIQPACFHCNRQRSDDPTWQSIEN